MINKYLSKEHISVLDKELNELYQKLRLIDENYILEEISKKPTKKALFSFLRESRGEYIVYNLYIYEEATGDYVILQDNVDKKNLEFFIKGYIHFHERLKK